MKVAEGDTEKKIVLVKPKNKNVIYFSLLDLRCGDSSNHFLFFRLFSPFILTR